MTKKEAKQVSNWEGEAIKITVKRIDNGLLLEINDDYRSVPPAVPNMSRAFSEGNWDYLASEAERYMRSRIAAIKAKMTEEATA